MLQTDMDLPMNWLPPDPSLAIDYDSIVGLGFGSLDFFALPNIATDGSSVQNNAAQGSTAAQLNAKQQHDDSTARLKIRLPLAGDLDILRNNHYTEVTESHVSSSSPYSAAHTVSPSEAPGGLYATSINGARMPCTIRARRDKSLLPGARPIRRLNQLRHHKHYEAGHDFSFPDTNHIVLEGPLDTNNGSTHAVTVLLSSTYEDIMQGFRKLCLEETFGFHSYTSSNFPDISSLNLCIRLYFENFDATMPILHDQVTCINDHWTLALAVSAIGCQYAEADEYAQMVEPMHEFLRRAITVTVNTEPMAAHDQYQRHQLAFTQARTLSQVGMLYSGSPRLRSFAMAQQSAMIELARSLIDSEALPTRTVYQGSDEQASIQLAWREMLLKECKRRIGYSIWVSCDRIFY